uniref:Uncharacterized protein n=1 Tax=Utricularia reniformis TaxID=192314 RepID=A0A1Y0B300_9LAMI|nr:hypothetical protein AEK19_MT1631 [Utricularia reniformis]ART31815.1 hypothetical protein AEK19_MT1631 [Utricularia reniformis]
MTSPGVPSPTNVSYRPMTAQAIPWVGSVAVSITFAFNIFLFLITRKNGLNSV